jgi:hypothetical protein
MASLKRGSYSGSNGGICGFFEKAQFGFTQGIQVLNHFKKYSTLLWMSVDILKTQVLYFPKI